MTIVAGKAACSPSKKQIATMRRNQCRTRDCRVLWCGSSATEVDIRPPIEPIMHGQRRKGDEREVVDGRVCLREAEEMRKARSGLIVTIRTVHLPVQRLAQGSLDKLPFSHNVLLGRVTSQQCQLRTYLHLPGAASGLHGKTMEGSPARWC